MRGRDSAPIRGPARATLAAAIAALLLAGCSPSTRPAFERDVVVFGYLHVGEAVTDSNAISVSETRPIDSDYDPAEAAVSGALVTLQADGAAAPDTLAMVAPGRYANPALRIAPLTTYRLVVRTGDRIVTASTTTPAPITFLREPVEVPGTMAQAAIGDSFPIVVAGPDPTQIVLLDLYCLEDRANAVYVHPVADHEVPKNDREYGTPNGPPRHVLAYFHLGDLVPVPGGWRAGFYGDMMVFYGRYRVSMYAIDDNEYQYLYRDDPERHGGIVGGIGVFGSVSGRAWTVDAVR